MTDDDDILAAEFAFGLLSEADAEAVRARAISDSVLSLRIVWWRDQMAPLIDEIAAAPPAGLWPKIASQLSVNDNAPTLLRRWRAAAVAAMAVAAALLVVVGLRPGPAPLPTPSAPLVATLSGPKNSAIVTVSYDAASGQMTVSPAHLDAGAGDAELWIIPEDGKARSLGVINANAPAGRAVAADRRAFVHAGATFAISLESKGGSPTGSATGPIVVTGKIIRV